MNIGNSSTQPDHQQWEKMVRASSGSDMMDGLDDDPMYDSYDETRKMSLSERFDSLGTVGHCFMIVLLGLCIGAVGAWTFDRLFSDGSTMSDLENTVQEVKPMPVDPDLLRELEALSGGETSQDPIPEEEDGEIPFDLSMDEGQPEVNISRYTQGDTSIRRNSEVGREAALSSLPMWRRYSVTPTVVQEGLPIIAIVVDNILQANDPVLEDFLSLNVPLTFSILPTAQGASAFAERAYEQSNELLVDIPMASESMTDAGANTIAPDLDDEELKRRIDWSLQQFGQFIGIANYKGDIATADAGLMTKVMQAIQPDGLLYFESQATLNSQSIETSQKFGVVSVESDFDIQADKQVAAVTDVLNIAAQRASRSGSAVITIPATADAFVALSDWLSKENTKTFVASPLTTVVKLRTLDQE